VETRDRAMGRVLVRGVSVLRWDRPRVLSAGRAAGARTVVGTKPAGGRCPIR
jgi:hypothetical protein